MSGFCSSGPCVAIETCSNDYANCNGILGDGCEANLMSSTSHCGSCGQACAPGQTCSAGTCVSSCPYTMCNGVCTNTNTNINHCGGCNQACAGTIEGALTYNCLSGQCSALTCDEDNCFSPSCDSTNNRCNCGFVC
eukprot:TRINITY_DN34232_c0_g1_i1.p1 TRINITY_DN34232_c0_g1~~TRINITY_DN34232_c0_g1_i1.p1  ORF type:complete len:136 (+),score=16.47 TRINITY_DN34232_c0_g1_i1:368-775(+)